MSYNDAGVTRLTIILDKPADWESWFQLQREKAVVDAVWKYHNILKPQSKLPKLEEPVKPLPSDIRARATAIAQLDAGQQAIKDEVYDRLIALKKQFAPTTATRTRELIVKYRSLQEGPQSRDLEQ
ncbi:hypothetical protein B5807_03440 [Epicoccum nigrum]|uniref:Uncharacterized protein n=1 Tax=Epicoccum nigrum TaxID=105696 RepID=A0A1Y2M8T9_EPING|nr:hypothetical protein B5807_03440 [Epicoccum nigrum]